MVILSTDLKESISAMGDLEDRDLVSGAVSQLAQSVHSERKRYQQTRG